MNYYFPILLTLLAIFCGVLVSYFIIRRFSRSFEAFYVEAVRLKETGQLDQALAKFREVIWENRAKNFLTPSSYLSIAEIYFKKQDLDKSIHYVDMAIKNYKKYKYPKSFIEQAEKLRLKYQRQSNNELAYS